MSKRFLIAGAALLFLAMLAGCKALNRTDAAFDADTLSKAQKIVVTDAAGNEKAVLTEKEDLDAFVDAVNVANTGRWKFQALPEGLTEAGGFTLYQVETLTALIGQGEAKINEICTFRIYVDGDYLTIETGVMDFSFAIPAETAEYLRGMTA